MKEMKEKSNQGFALIELLVVLSIIGVLSGMVLVSVSEAKEKARDSKRVQEIAQINTAIQLFKSDKGTAPLLSGAGPSGTNCSRSTNLEENEAGFCVAISGEITGNAYNAWEAFKTEIGPYLNNQVPEDPCGSSCRDGFGYIYIAPAALGSAQTDEDYQIYATLERMISKTPQRKKKIIVQIRHHRPNLQE
jgi:prepilin-type N-terminal cleavage/methylation domain-containing protein